MVITLCPVLVAFWFVKCAVGHTASWLILVKCLCLVEVLKLLNKAGGLKPVERHTTPQNIRKFFDPNTYRSGVSGTCTPPVQKRPAVESPASSGSAKAPRMCKAELVEKFKLAAELNGVQWSDILES